MTSQNRKKLGFTVLCLLIPVLASAQFRSLHLLATTPVSMDPQTRYQQTLPCRKNLALAKEVRIAIQKQGEKLAASAQQGNAKRAQGFEKYRKLQALKHKLQDRLSEGCESKLTRSTRDAFRSTVRLLKSQMEQREIGTILHSYPALADLPDNQGREPLLNLTGDDVDSDAGISALISFRQLLNSIDEQQEAIIDIASEELNLVRRNGSEADTSQDPGASDEDTAGGGDTGSGSSGFGFGSPGGFGFGGEDLTAETTTADSYEKVLKVELREQFRALYDTKLTNGKRQFYPDPLNEPEELEKLDLLFTHYFVIRSVPGSTGQTIQLHLFFLDVAQDYTLYRKATLPRQWKNREADYTGAIGKELAYIAEQFANSRAGNVTTTQ